MAHDETTVAVNLTESSTTKIFRKIPEMLGDFQVYKWKSEDLK
jgi:hypothetical protein